MTASTSGESGDSPKGGAQDGPRRADMDVEKREVEGAVTITTFIEAPPQRTLRIGLLPLLMLAAGWTDALCYLGVGRVFASFMTGNILFVGLSIAQGNTALLVRAGVAVVFFLVSVTLGALYLQRLPGRQSVSGWCSTLTRYLLAEVLVLFAFGLLWLLVGNPTQRPAVQVVLLSIAALGMGLQGALLGAFNILDVNTIALTGTELLLGIRLAQRIGGQSVDQPAGTRVPFLVVLLLSYALAALVVALAMPWLGIAFIPCLLVAGAVVAILVTSAGKRQGE
jgi:uncharacterized membrane protein YoaK (UPF0700 family)